MLPPWVDDWLAQDHLARFVVEVLEQMDLSEFRFVQVLVLVLAREMKVPQAGLHCARRHEFTANGHLMPRFTRWSQVPALSRKQNTPQRLR